MWLYRKRKKMQQRAGKWYTEADSVRTNIARTIYSTVINNCTREAHTKSAYEALPQTAARLAVQYADELIKELNRTKQ